MNISELMNMGFNLKELQELNKQQDKQLKKLERLIQKSNDLCDDLDLSHLIINDCKLAKVVYFSFLYLLKFKFCMFFYSKKKGQQQFVSRIR